MRWWLLGSLTIAVLLEGLVTVDWPVLSAKLPLAWLALFLIISKEWIGWRQGLLFAALAGYLLDVLAAPVPGAVLVPMLAAWAAASVILMKYHYTAGSKLAALSSGSLIMLAGSFAPGPYLPEWLPLLWMAAVYVFISLGSYFIINSAVKYLLVRL